MELESVLLLMMFATLFGALMLGYPVAFTLAGISILFAPLAIGIGEVFEMPVGVLDLDYLALFPERIFGIMLNDVLLAVPLFIAMGAFLEKSKVAEDLLNAMAQLLRNVRGGLGMSITVVGALLAASTGIVGAAVVTMGLLSLPTLLKRGYDPAFAAGSICAAGTLGQIIPPSIVLVLLTDQLSGAWQQAQRQMGVFSVDALTVGDLFAGALLPGLGLVILYLIYQASVAFFHPEKAPPYQPRDDLVPEFGGLFRAFFPPIILILTVLGSILTGVATPTEAAAVGATGAILLAGIRFERKFRGPAAYGLLAFMALLVISFSHESRPGMPVLILAGLLSLVFAYGFWRSLLATRRANILQQVLTATVRISTMVFVILMGATLFSLVFRGFGGDILVADFLTELAGGPVMAIIVVMMVMFLLGFFLDFIEITFVVVPIVAPVLMMMGFDPIWLGLMMAINLQTRFLTPPFGVALFYLRSVAPPEVTTKHL